MIDLIGKSLKQWELGRQLKISSDEPFSEVHFARDGDSEALVVEPKEQNGSIVADIPNILLQDHRNLNAYLVNSSEGSEVVIDSVILGILPRAKPSDYVYTETEVRTYDALEKKFDEAIKGFETLTKQNAEILEGLETLDALTDSTLEKQNAYIGGGSE